MKFIVQILATSVHRLDEMISTLGGFAIAFGIGIMNFLAGYKVAILVVIAAILFDMIWGVAAAKKMGKFVRSELLRDTINKIGAYGTAIAMVILIENLAFGSHEVAITERAHSRFIVDIVATLIAAVEFWSICGNILIVHPNAVFFRLLKFPLVGEIARKLQISEDQVKDIFDNQEKANTNDQGRNN